MLRRLISLFILVGSFSLICLQGEEVSPFDLIVPQRADLMAKYIYAKQRSWETVCPFGKELYFHHLKVWNGFFDRTMGKTRSNVMNP